MVQSKYIVFTSPASGRLPVAVIFPDCMIHSDVAARLLATVVGAGFVSIAHTPEGIQVKPHGHSESLKIGSRPEDKRFIEKALGL
jgi:hypothetical protein